MSTKTARVRSSYRCSECGWETAKWVGRCGECQAWGSVAEAGAPTLRAAAGPVSTPAVPIGQVATTESVARPSGVPELDRVLGGGLVPGAAILLAGEPGVGKSTLLLEVAAQTARTRQRTLYVTGEESAAQVRLRADRTGGVHDELFLAAETDLGAVLTHIEDVRPTLLVVDSIQTIGASGIDGVPGGVTQVKEVAAALIRVAKTRNITTVIVGHVTKDGSIAGPRVLEHLVDVVLHFEGDRNSRFRMVRAMKNRYGPVDEVGLLRPLLRGHLRRHRPDRALRRAPHPGRLRHLRGRDDGGTPTAAGRGAGAADAVAARATPPHGLGRRVVAGRHGARRAPAARPAAHRGQRHLRRDRRRRQAARPGGRPGHRGRRGQLPPRRAAAARRRRHRRDRARRRAAPGARPAAAHRRGRRGSASRWRSSRAGGRRPASAASPRRRVVDGLRVVEVDDVVRRAAHPRPDASPLTPTRPTAVGPRVERSVDRAHAPTLHPMAHGGARGESTWRTGGRAHRRAAEAARDPGLDRAGHAAARRPRADPPRPHRRPDRAGAGQDRRVDLHRRLHPRRPLHRHRPARAGQDGRRDHPRQGHHPHPPRGGPPDARPHDPLRGDRHPAPHRRAGRQADRPPGHLGVAVDADHRRLRRRHPPRARGLRQDPVPRQPGPGHPRALQAPPRRGLRDPVRARDRGPRHRARRRRRRPAPRDGHPDRPARSRTTSSSSAPTAACSRSSSRSSSPASTPSASSSSATTCPAASAARPAPSPTLAELEALSPTELVDPAAVARAIGLGGAEHLDAAVAPRGYRLLAKVPRLPAAVVDRLVDHFGGLQQLLSAGIDDLQAVEGVGELRARSVREGLSRLAESSITERYI